MISCECNRDACPETLPDRRAEEYTNRFEGVPAIGSAVLTQIVTPAISIVILNGGRSRRMGMNKSQVVLDPDDSLSLIERILHVVSSLSDDVLIVGGGNGASIGNTRHVEDAYPGQGPLGGLVTGMGAMRYGRCLLLACDMPFVNIELVRLMAALGAEDVVAQTRESRIEPFHAIYHRRCLPRAVALLAEGERSMERFLLAIDRRLVPETIIDAIDPKGWSLLNINTPADLLVARIHASELRVAADGTSA
jgi:molybdopterin-guanine dinucleotide biosynthesis protein A